MIWGVWVTLLWKKLNAISTLWAFKAVCTKYSASTLTFRILLNHLKGLPYQNCYGHSFPFNIDFDIFFNKICLKMYDCDFMFHVFNLPVFNQTSNLVLLVWLLMPGRHPDKQSSSPCMIAWCLADNQTSNLVLFEWLSDAWQTTRQAI